MAVDVPRQRRRPPFLCDALLVRRLRLGHPVLGAEPARHLRLLPARLPVGGRHRLCAPFLGRLLARRRPGRHARRRRPRARVATHLRLGQRLDRLAKLVPAWPATMGGPRRRRGPPPPRAPLHRHRAALLVRLRLLLQGDCLRHLLHHRRQRRRHARRQRLLPRSGAAGPRPRLHAAAHPRQHSAPGRSQPARLCDAACAVA
mmetsp:Transcript_27406/g.81891  ORF Transcript_27406/g.81891 Transcript_27406/m.81891 type:complete len:202 (-) Transcript_27406:376-981(-)